MTESVVIIGSGLGGLECGYILSKKGYKVTVLEKESQTGGCLQTFTRGNLKFDTGFHYVGGLAPGQPLYRLFEYFNLLHLPWHQMDPQGFDQVVLDGECFLFANYTDNANANPYKSFARQMAAQFPKQAEALNTYATFLQEVGDKIIDNQAMPLFELGAYSYLDKLFHSDKKLINVLSGTSAKMELDHTTLPLYTFAQINSSYIQSAWRLCGGGSQITDSLVESIRRMGGTVLTGCKVTQLLEKEGRIVGVELTRHKGEREVLPTDIVISDIHPASTLGLISQTSYLRKSFRQRIQTLPNTSGMFTVNIELKDGCVPYQNRNIFIHHTEDYPCGSLWKGESKSLMISYYVPTDGSSWAKGIDLICAMPWKEMEPWAGTTVGHRDQAYIAFKEQKAMECIKRACEVIPELSAGIEKYYTSTPLSYRDYTGTPEGSAYGIKKDFNHTLTTILAPKTPISNLYLTGQNLNLHGILGVTITSTLTCQQVMGS